MPVNVYEAYRETEVLSADPVQLVRMLYRAAIESIEKGRRLLSQGDIIGRNREITRAMTILNELVVSLDHDRGGELSRNLLLLYDYVLRLLQDANFRQTEPPLAEAAKLLSIVLEGWDGIAPGSPLATEPVVALDSEPSLVERVSDYAETGSYSRISQSY